MEKHVEIIITRKDGKTEKMVSENIDSARGEIENKLKIPFYQSASILVKEYEKDTPNKMSVWIENYQNDNGKIVKVSY